MADERVEPSTLVASIDDGAAGRWQIITETGSTYVVDLDERVITRVSSYAPFAGTMSLSSFTQSSKPASEIAAASSYRSVPTPYQPCDHVGHRRPQEAALRMLWAR